MTEDLTGTLHQLVEMVALVIDVVGVVVIVAGLVVATLRFARRASKVADAYHQFRLDLGKGILLGLEFLVAADVIKTVAITPTFRSVGILAIIVVIRTFLSWALELELEGRWPWQRSPARAQGPADLEGPPRA